MNLWNSKVLGELTMQCEFEEKEYEQPLNYELAWKRRVYSPGQVFENKIAIDAAVFSRNQKFWNLWSNCEKMTWKSGTKLKREFWDLVEETWNSIVSLPDDVSIRTSDDFGTLLRLLWDFWEDWSLPRRPVFTGWI